MPSTSNLILPRTSPVLDAVNEEEELVEENSSMTMADTPKPPPTKRSKLKRDEVELILLKKSTDCMVSLLAKKDERGSRPVDSAATFGNYIASELRGFSDPMVIAQIKNNISEIIFKAHCGEYTPLPRPTTIEPVLLDSSSPIDTETLEANVVYE